MNRRQFRIKHDGFQTRYALLCFISNYGDSRHGNIMPDIKNFFISTTSQKESKEGRISLRISKNASVCKESLLDSADVWTTLRTEHLSLITMEGMPQE